MSIASDEKKFRNALLSLQKKAALLSNASKFSKNAVPGQPLDPLLLEQSALYRKSRELYLKSGGRYRPNLVSSKRNLTDSPILLEPLIEYSPCWDELTWAANDKSAVGYLFSLRAFPVKIFHEQNHRLLWGVLNGCPKPKSDYRKYLNFAESIIIATDIALADELGELAGDLWLTGVLYPSGKSDLRFQPGDRRNYRNYLLMFMYATYLTLEFHSPKRVEEALLSQFPQHKNWPSALARKAITKRASALNFAFIGLTVRSWQKKFKKDVLLKLNKTPHLILPSEYDSPELLCSWSSKWFARIGL